MTDKAPDRQADLYPKKFEEPNYSHNPSRNTFNLKPRPGWLLLHYFPQPTKDESRGGMTIPAKEKRAEGKTRAGQIDVEHPPNCARVFAAGDDCKAEPGDYVFFAQRVENVHEAYRRKPQPLIPYFDPMDRLPMVFALRDEYVIAEICHAGDAAVIEVSGTVELLSLVSGWVSGPCTRIRQGERFRTFDDGGRVNGVYVALTAAKEAGEDKVAVLAAPYDGPEANE